MQALRNDTSLTVARLIVAERRAVEAEGQRDMMMVTSRRQALEIKLLQSSISKIEEENERQVRLKLVVVAAKLKYQEMTHALEKKLQEEQRRRNEVQVLYDEAAREMIDAESYVSELQQVLHKSQESEATAVQMAQLQKAELLSHSLQTQSLISTIQQLKGGKEEPTFSPKQQEAWDQMTAEAAHWQESNFKLQKQLKTALHRAYELEGQLLEARKELER